MSISTYILDDENSARERLVFLLKEFFKEQILILGQNDSPAKAIDEILSATPDLVFLDIEMPGMSGLELAQKLRNKGYQGKIVFVTAYDHYAIKAIRMKAYDYILKPVDVDELKQLIERMQADNEHTLNPEAIRNFELSKREVELINHLCKGSSSEEIASEMFLSKHTVDTHRRNILLKTGARNTLELLNMLRS